MSTKTCPSKIKMCHCGHFMPRSSVSHSAVPDGDLGRCGTLQSYLPGQCCVQRILRPTRDTWSLSASRQDHLVSSQTDLIHPLVRNGKRCHRVISSGLQRFRSFGPRRLRAFLEQCPAPDQRLTIPAHSSYHVVFSQVRFSEPSSHPC